MDRPVRQAPGQARFGGQTLPALTCLVLAVLAAGCGSRSTGDPTPTASSPSLRAPAAGATSANPAISARDKAIAAYRGMWAAYQTAGQNADPNFPDLTTYATDAALQTLTNGLKSIKDRGLIAKGEVVLSPRVTAVEPADRPTSIEITDCVDDSKALLYRTSGEPYNDRPGGPRLVIATVKDTGNGVWKVTSFGARDVGTC